MPSVQKMSLTATGMPAELALRRLRRAALGRPQIGVERVARPRPRGRRRSTRRRESSPERIRSAACGDGQVEQLARHLGLRRGNAEGRRRRGPARAPAPRSRGQLGRGSSGRSTFSSSITCEVGSTPSRSSSEMRSTCSRIADSSPAIRSTSSSLSCRRASRATCRTCSRSITRGILGGGVRDGSCFCDQRVLRSSASPCALSGSAGSPRR